MRVSACDARLHSLPTRMIDARGALEPAVSGAIMARITRGEVEGHFSVGRRVVASATQ